MLFYPPKCPYCGSVIKVSGSVTAGEAWFF